MKFVIDERIKNRLTGLVVIISIAVIFLPAMMKKSNHRFDESINIALKLPQKPQLPKVAIPNQKTMFQSVKVAHVEIPTVTHVERTSQFAKAETLHKPTNLTPEQHVAKNVVTIPPSTQVAKLSSPHIAVAPSTKVMAQPKLAANKAEKMTYAVQLASFTQQENAKILVTRLRQQGYTASYSLHNGKQGKYYQVLVGKVNQKDEAMNLQKKLVAHLQLSGFIVKTNVG